MTSQANQVPPSAGGDNPGLLSSIAHVYSFGDGEAQGDRSMRNLLGGKGANLAEMCKLGLPVPAGFTISTDVCDHFVTHKGEYPSSLRGAVAAALTRVEASLQRKFGDPSHPLLVSVRSGARVSMPGMMDTVLNLGLNDETVEGLAERSGNPRFAWDAYRRFVQMYGDVVLGVGPGPGEEVSPFSTALEDLKAQRGASEDTDLDADDLRGLVATFKAIIAERSQTPFPSDPQEQLWGAIGAVFGSWNNPRAITYREMNNIPGEWGTAVTVVAMVYGNMGETSGTGVAFTRNPSTGERQFYGEYLMNAQGEDVVAGIRTPRPITELADSSPAAWAELKRIQELLEDHYADMQDLEFTIEEGRLFMLQCRTGKRTAFAAVRIANDLVAEGRITKSEALLRIDPESLNQLVQPIFDDAEKDAAARGGRLLCIGLNAGPGAASGHIVFSQERACERAAAGDPVILVRIETSPEDIRGMQVAQGILTARGGMTSHAALVARQMGKVCVAGADALVIDYKQRSMAVAGKRLNEGDWISLDGSTGEVLQGKLETHPSEVIQALFGEGAKKERARASTVFTTYRQLMKWADSVRRLRVRTNADQPDQCARATAFGAEGVGLCRTEHMFFGEEKIEAMREMILAPDKESRKQALAKLLPLQRADFEGIFEVMQQRPVTIRTLDPPLHEFLPAEPELLAEVAQKMGLERSALDARIEALKEVNPMLGHRGCRLGIVYPEITRMQVRAILEAACNVARRGTTPRPEIMIPLVSTARELELQERIVREVAEKVFAREKIRVPYLVGTMIELPRAALTADEIACHAEFFSFGTNDLTQTAFGISRDDSARFIPEYVQRGIFLNDPFARLDERGVGDLMTIATERGRASRPDLKIGICGEHGGDPASVAFCDRLGLEYVSCSPYRVPIARLAAAQAALRPEA